MKLKHLVLPVVVGSSLSILSCGEKKKEASAPVSEDVENAVTAATKEVQTAAEKAANAAAPVAEKVAEMVKGKATAATPEKLAEQLGFAAYLPAETNGYLSFLKLGDSLDRMLETKLGKLLLDIAKENGEDIKGDLQRQEAQMARAVLGEEVFISFGNGSGEQLAQIIELSKIYNYVSGYSMTKMAEAAVNKDVGMPTDAQKAAILEVVIKDYEKVVTILEKAELPPITVGIKVSDETMRNGIAGMIKGQFVNLLNEEDAPIEGLELEKDGVSLTGFKIKGTSLVSEISERDREQLAEFLKSKEKAEKLIQKFAEKEIVVATGVKDDHIVVYAGGSIDGFQLVEKPADSFLARPEMKFMDNYHDKDLRLFSYLPEFAAKPTLAHHEGFGSMAQGAHDALAKATSLGDTRDMQRLLKRFVTLDGELFGNQKFSSSGAVAFLEDGLKVEAHGGSDLSSVDFKTKHQFASVSQLEGVAVFLNSATDEKFAKKVGEMFGIGAEIVGLIIDRVGNLENATGEIADFNQKFKLFESMFKDDALEIWKALADDLGEGLGNESSFIIDLKGTFPKVPVLPGVIVEQGKIPRIAWASTVVNRAKVGKSWDRINGAITRLLEKGKAFGMDIPMQVPFDTETDGLKSYFFPLPMLTPNAMPSTSVSDEFFFISTSPQFAGELVKAAKAGGVERQGTFGKIDFSQLLTFTGDWLELVKNNQEAVFNGDKYAQEDFVKNLPIIERVLTAAGELEDLSMHSRRENGESRASFHFNLK